MIRLNQQIISPLFVGLAPLHDGICGYNDEYDGNTYCLQECLDKCIAEADCSSISYMNGPIGCGIHKGAIQTIPNTNDGTWPSGFSCYARPSKSNTNLYAILFFMCFNYSFTQLLNYIVGAANTLALTLAGRRRRSGASGNNICLSSI